MRFISRQTKTPSPTTPKSPLSPAASAWVRRRLTSRGLNEEDMTEVGEIISLAITDFDARAEELRRRVGEICKKYPLYE